MKDGHRQAPMIIVNGRVLGYNDKLKSKHENASLTKEGGNKDMAKVINRVMSVQLPPHQLKELGMEKNWQKKVSPSFVEKVTKTAHRYESALKELSKR